ITTSEGQGYALLRAVWADDSATFQKVWSWTKQTLQVRSDKLFAWKWKEQILDPHSASDADTDIALALILASRRFSDPSYQQEALLILNSIRAQDVLQAGPRYIMTGGDWATSDPTPTIHTAYLAPYAYRVFADVDKTHPWSALIDSS